jgi:hypothetical protein
MKQIKGGVKGKRRIDGPEKEARKKTMQYLIRWGAESCSIFLLGRCFPSQLVSSFFPLRPH